MQTIEADSPLPDDLVDRIDQADRVAVLTGAGVSAESGIPTFRDAQTGMWSKFDPMMLATPEGFEQDPQTVWDWYQWRRRLIAEKRPNPGHQALASMENHFDALTLITQNVDGFHQLAGSSRVLELHGNIQRNICSRTLEDIAADWIEQHADERPPRSPHHPEGLARPDVVWFGEALDTNVLERAYEAAGQCQIMIIAGTSGAVQPAASIPLIAREAGARLIDINPEASELSPLAHWHLAGPSAHWLPMLSQRLGGA